MSGELAILNGATRALAEVSNAAEAWQLARDAEAVRMYAKMRNLGTEATNYATGIKAKAMLLVAQFVDRGQAEGTIAAAGRPTNSGGHTELSVPEVLDSVEHPQHAYEALRDARRLRDALVGVDVDRLVADANAEGVDFGLAGLRLAAAEKYKPEPVVTPPPPEGRYRTIIIDPPWPVTKAVKLVRPDQGVDLDYPTLPIRSDDGDSIEKLPIAELGDPRGSHLYLWTTHKLLPDALALVEGWGFRYQCLLTWVKTVGVSPFSWMYDTEHCIFARGGGGLDLLQMGLRLSIHAGQQPHSAKPDEFYERVAAASPAPRLEMFARRERDGFEPWRNEVA